MPEPRPPAAFGACPATERLANLDVLRALSLFGVLLVNLLTEFRVSIFAQFLGPAMGSRLDQGIDRFVGLAIESKAFVLFSLLFGVGLAIQLERARASERAFGVHLARRLGALLAIGLVHLVLVWNGDILTEYAIAGFLIAPILGRSRGVLLAVALVCFVVFAAPLPYPEPFASRAAIAAHVAEANRIYGGGSAREVLAFRVHELPPILALDLSALPRTLGLFALGGLLWRAGVLQRPGEHRRLLGGVALGGIGIGGGLTLFTAGVFSEPPESLGAWASVLEDVAAIGLALGYGGAFLLVFEVPWARPLLIRLAPLGQMALTNYLAQSVVFGLVFYGYGLGRFGTMSVTSAAALGVTTYAAQAAVSAWWLKRFRFGPVEWGWRAATYGRWPRLREGSL